MKVIQLDAAELTPTGGIHIRNPKAFLLTQWLEKGVFKSLQDEVLEILTFAICNGDPMTGDDVLSESYDFHFSFLKSNSVVLNGSTISSKTDVKAQAAKFIRNLISFSRTLEEIDENSWITLQLKVNIVKTFSLTLLC